MTRHVALGLLLWLTAIGASAETIIVRSDNCIAADVAYEPAEDELAPVDLNPWRVDFDFRDAYVAVPIDGRRGRRGPRIYVPVDLEGDPHGIAATEDCED